MQTKKRTFKHLTKNDRLRIERWLRRGLKPQLEALDGSYHIEEEEMLDDSHSRSIAVSIQKLVIEPVNSQLDYVLQHVTLEDLKNNYLDYKEYNQDMYYI